MSNSSRKPPARRSWLLVGLLSAAVAGAVALTAGPAVTATGSAAACRADQLTGQVTGHGSMSSQPFTVVGLHNTSGAACLFNGYAALTATGHPGLGGGTDAALLVSVTEGPVMTRPDPGPHEITVAPGGWATLSIGTGTAYQDLYTITSVGIVMPGGGTLPLAVTMAAGAPQAQAIPVGVTAFAAGAS